MGNEETSVAAMRRHKRLARVSGHSGDQAGGRAAAALPWARRDCRTDVTNCQTPATIYSFDEMVSILQSSNASTAGTCSSAIDDGTANSPGAIYARNSDPIRQDTISAQIERCRAYALSKSIPVPDAWVFAEKRSGLDRGRPEYHKLMALARTKRIKHVIVFLSDRLGRDAGMFIQDMRALEDLGVTVHTHMGKISWEMVPILAVINEMSSRNLSMHVANKQADLVKQGRIMGRMPFGYRRRPDGTWDIVLEEAAIIVEMFRRLAGGQTLYKVALWFSALVGVPVDGVAIGHRLRNPIYMGIYRFRARRNGRFTKGLADDPPLFCQMEHLRIVDTKLWLDANRARPYAPIPGAYSREAGPRHVLQGILYCARCTLTWRRGGPHHGQAIPVRLRVKGDQRYPSYGCRECHGRLTEARILASIERCVFAIPVGPYVTQALARRPSVANDSVKRIRHLRQRLEDIRKERDDLIRESFNRFNPVARVFSEEDIARVKRRIDEEIASVERQIIDCEVDIEATGQTYESLAWLKDSTIWSIYPTLSTDERHEILTRCIASCHVDLVTDECTIRWQPAVARLLTVETTNFIVPNPRRLVPYVDLKRVVQELHIASAREYRDAVRADRVKSDAGRVVARPEYAYGAEWEGWETFLGMSFVPYAQACIFARTLGFTMRAQYRDWVRGKTVIERHGLPTNPQIIYRDKGWGGWAAFLCNSPIVLDEGEGFEG